MLIHIRKSLLLPLLFGAVIPTAAQDRYTVTLQSYSSTGSSHTHAYVYESVDIPPHFPGGDGALVRYINNHRNYPCAAYEAGVEGRVVCGFIVGPNGVISNVEVVRSVDPSLDDEAKRVISGMPAWEAGRIEDTAVPVYCILAIPFRR